MERKIAISMGDPAGIGAEVLVKALAALKKEEQIRPWLFGDIDVLSRAAEKWGDKLKLYSSSEMENRKDGIPVFPVCALDAADCRHAQSTVLGAKAQLACFEEAARQVLAGNAHALVTAPVNKEAIRRFNPQFSGHTEHLAHLCKQADPVMAFYSDKLLVALVTTHLGLAEVPQALSSDKIIHVIEQLAAFTSRMRPGKKPRIGVCGLNPHAGQDVFGKEEAALIEPAVQHCREVGLEVNGPFAADTLFRRAVDGEFDAIVGMYHDQALIPLKLLDPAAVNVTLGLNIIRTSPGHGVAYPIAGRGRAHPQSMQNALLLAARIVEHMRAGGEE